MKKRAAFSILFFIISISIFAIEIGEPVPAPYGPAEFPEWQKDLRRAEIISFGALPFLTFFSSIYYDIYRYGIHDGDERYLPWPLKKSDIAIPLTEKEQKNIFFTAASLSLGVAVFDYTFRAIKRSIGASRMEKASGDTPGEIIIEPLNEIITGESPDGDSEN